MTPLFHRLFRQPLPIQRLCLRALSTTPICHGPKPLPPRPTIDEGDITEAFLKGTGPGGQKINKTSSAVQLKHLPTGLVIKCQETRSRSQNRKIARRILAERIEDMEKGDESRSAIKLGKAQKKKASKDKKARRKYRKLAEGEGESDGVGEDVADIAEDAAEQEGGELAGVSEPGLGQEKPDLSQQRERPNPSQKQEMSDTLDALKHTAT